jgi:hypothetical protein
MGIEPHIIEAALNHASIHSQLTGAYNAAHHRPQVADALQRFADRLDIIAPSGATAPRDHARRLSACRSRVRRISWTGSSSRPIARAPSPTPKCSPTGRSDLSHRQHLRRHPSLRSSQKRVMMARENHPELDAIASQRQTAFSERWTPWSRPGCYRGANCGPRPSQRSGLAVRTGGSRARSFRGHRCPLPKG